MKISNNALNFLLAQYRAIFKRAYVKGIASAVILTAGLAAGQAQATPSETNPFWTTSDDSTWSSGTAYSGSVSAKRVAGDYDTGAEGQDGIVSGETLIIGDSGAAVGGDIGTLASGSAYAGYVSLSSGSALDAIAENNKLTVTTSGTITSTGNLVGGWAKTQGTGTALATGNTLQISNIETLSSGGQFIGGMAGGYNGATAEGNTVSITGINNDDKILSLNNTGNIGGIVFVGDGTSAGDQLPVGPAGRPDPAVPAFQPYPDGTGFLQPEYRGEGLDLLLADGKRL